MELVPAGDNRWELYKVISDPARLRLLAAASDEELAIGELAEVLGESQPTVSRQIAPLRRLGLLSERRQGTRVFVRLRADATADPVVADAVRSGRQLCAPDGVLDRVSELVRRRDADAREFFARSGAREDDAPFPSELPAYLRVVSSAGGGRGLAVDIGTGDGRLLEVLAPSYRQVLAVDREPTRLARAAERVHRRAYDNVELIQGDLGDEALSVEVARRGTVDAVFAARVLHHAPRPAEAVRSMAALVGDGGSLVLLDYAPHQDETMRASEADLWLGFSADELRGYTAEAGLTHAVIEVIPSALCGAGPDAHLPWHVCIARRPSTPRI